MNNFNLRTVLSSTDLRKHYNQISAQIKAAGQNPLENNSDSRINKIFDFIVESGLTMEYVSDFSTKKLLLPKKSDDEALWVATQPRNSNSNSDRKNDETVKNRAHGIVNDINSNKWSDFDNPPIGFNYNGFHYWATGNGRIGSIDLAEKELGGETIPFGAVMLDVSGMTKDILLAFCQACSQKSNSDDGKSVEKESADQIASAVQSYWKQVQFYVKNPNNIVISYYKEAVEYSIEQESKNTDIKKIRKHVCESFLQKHKNVQSPKTQGRYLSQAFDDYVTTTGGRFDLGGDLLNHLNQVVLKQLRPLKVHFSTIETGRHEISYGSKQMTIIIVDTDDERMIINKIFNASLKEDGRDIIIVSKPSSAQRISLDGRQTKIERLLKKFNFWHTVPINKNHKASTILAYISLRSVDNSATDKDGNYDCDVVYQFNACGYTRMDDGKFGRQEKLSDEVSFNDDDED